MMREIRCFPYAQLDRGAWLNTWSGSAGRQGAGTFWIVRAVIEGNVEPQTGYLCNIKEVDSFLRDDVVPAMCRRMATGGDQTHVLASAVRSVVQARRFAFGQGVLTSLELDVSPFLHIRATAGDLNMVYVTHSFEFSASHRLFCKSLSDEQNRNIFGKCTNPNGHGHNYILEVTVGGDPDAAGGTATELLYVERLVKEKVIDRFDHKHLNLDCPEFRELNPTVENIARVIWERLCSEFTGCKLSRIRVWETAKTYAEYEGED